MSTRDYSGVAIAGFGETAYLKQSDRPAMWFVADAIRRALAASSLRGADVDGLVVTSYRIAPDTAVNVAEHLGLELRWLEQGVWGGAAGVISILRAARAIQDGDAETVVCVAADNMTVASNAGLLESFSVPFRDYVFPHGAAGANGVFALMTRHHMEQFGVTREQLGKLAVTQRAHARLNENALLRAPLTLDEYLAARLIVDPLRLYDCCLPCCGGDAVVVTSRERARSLTRTPVFIRGGGEMHNYRRDDPVQTVGGWAAFRDALYAQAGMAPADIEMVQVYDDYPIVALMQLEDLGFCPKGTGGRFLADTDISLTGTLPVNTGGGQLSAGQAGAAGGMLGVVEAVRQLQGRAGDRQIPGVSRSLVSGYGSVSFDRCVCSSAMILGVDP